MATYVLVAIVKKQFHLDLLLHAMLQILSVTPFEKMPFLRLLTDTAPMQVTATPDNQMIML